MRPGLAETLLQYTAIFLMHKRPSDVLASVLPSAYRSLDLTLDQAIWRG
jgi:hypothetical protein